MLGLGSFYKGNSLFFVMGEILFKVHESYRWVVAICDKDVYGRKLVEGVKALDLRGEFFHGEVMSEADIEAEIVRCNREDATFNFVGDDSVALAKRLGIVKDGGVVMIDGVPVALVLL